MLGYAFMGKAHSNALKKIAYITWPPPLVPSSSASRAGTRRPSARRRPATATSTRRPTGGARRRRPDRALRQRRPNSLHGEPTIAAAEAGSTYLREAARPRQPTRATRSGGASRPPASSTSAGSTTASYRPPARPRDDRGRRARRGPAFPRAATFRTGATTRRSTPGASSRTQQARARSATSARTSSTSRGS